MIDMQTAMNLAKTRFQLGRRTLHGVSHWQRVRENGLKLAKQNDADKEVIELFACLHDCCRESDGADQDHGVRAAEFVWDNRAAIDLVGMRFELLCEAIEFHADGLHHTDMTIATCWDADRLDIGRVGKRPQTRYLSTREARQKSLIEWCYKRSRR